MIAALQMYDWPEATRDNDRFWALTADRLRAAGIAAPDRLSRGGDQEEAWTRPDLLVAQTCGLPMISGTCGDAVCVGRPVFEVEGASGGNYSSALVCRREDAGPLAEFSGRRAAINDYGSQSGCNALADAVREAGGGDAFFGAITISGSHRASARLVAKGEADLAAIDAVAWALFAAHDPADHTRLTVIGWTKPTPALPYITGSKQARHGPAIVQALDAAAMGVNGQSIPARVIAADADAYAPISTMAGSLRGLRLTEGGPALGSTHMPLPVSGG